MGPERWRQIERLYHLALEHDGENRSRVLDEASAGDRELREEVESLLKQTGGDSRLDRAVWVPTKTIRTRLAAYEIEGSIGAGGMGSVFRAWDSRLKRTVAIKVSKKPLSGRFKREAQAVAALNHPNIVQIYDWGSSDGDDYIVMEFVPGRTLDELIQHQTLSVDEAIALALQIASALAAAHASGIVHRDLKPGNIMVDDAWRVKVLDFGLAKYEENYASVTDIAPSETVSGQIIGTPSYMSPEQAQGQPTDIRSDVFSFGALLYEMLTSRPAFAADSTFGILSRVVRDSPPQIRRLRPEVSWEIVRLVERCLEKDSARRYASASELEIALRGAAERERAATRRLTIAGSFAAALMAVVAAAIWWHSRQQHLHWAQIEAPPKIQSLVLKGDYFGAFDLTRAALRYDPDNGQLKQHWHNVALPLKMTTEPAGAKVFLRPFGSADLPWKVVGITPLDHVPVPFAHGRVRVQKEGMEPLEFSTFTLFLQGQKLQLHRAGSSPPGMLRVPEHALPTPAKIMQLPDFFLDKFEVTNRQFQGFIDSDGYRTRKYWRHRFVRNGRDVPWEQAVSAFRDLTGRPGPAFWELGTYPKDQADYPVAGVNWFEAAAYCEQVGKSLPTMYHWQKAAGFGLYSDIVLFSNFTGRGPMRVGANPGITPFGVYDMAGNVQEWVSNSTGERRLILGGSFGEPAYPFDDVDARDPFSRLPTFGIRCASFPTPVPAESLSAVAPPERNYSAEKPVSNEVFEVFRRLYAYDKAPIAAQAESVDTSNALWRKERVSFAAAYGDERILAYLFLPKNAKPPYQTVVFSPGGWAYVLRSSEGVSTDTFDFLLRTGRAVLYPVYKGTFERHSGHSQGPNLSRETLIQLAQDVFRSVDYLETRTDIDSRHLGYYGMSQGATLGPIILALDSRLQVAVLNSANLSSEKKSPEIDILNFAPRVRAPVLMLGGRYDFVAPPETLQKPLFQLLGTKASDKQFIQLDSGHVPPLQDVMRESLNWFDHYFGSVKPNVNAVQ